MPKTNTQKGVAVMPKHNRAKNIQKLQKALSEDKSNKKPIEIRELVAYQVHPQRFLSPLGEFDASRVATSIPFNGFRAAKESEKQVIRRMSAHIYELVSKAAQIHLTDNFTQEKYLFSLGELYQSAVDKAQSKKRSRIIHAMNDILAEYTSPDIDPDKSNRITRLTMNEFSLYPHKARGPLSLNGFQQLVEEIDIAARYAPENLHLILGTVPVQTREGHIQNIAIFVQCGKWPVLHTFAKAAPSRIDPVYPEQKNLDFRDLTDENIILPSVKRIPSGAISQNGRTIHYGGNIICKTAGGATYRTVIDICLDHHFAVGKNLMLQEIERSHHSVPLPLQASYVLSSNVIPLEPSSVVTDWSIQSDPVFSAQMKGLRKKLDIYIKPDLRETIENPKFGSMTIVDGYPYQTLATHKKKMDARIQLYNQFHNKLTALHLYRSQHVSELKEIDVEINEHILTSVLALKSKSKKWKKEVPGLKSLVTDRSQLIAALDKLLKKSLPVKLNKKIAVAIRLLKQEQKITAEFQGFFSSNESSKKRLVPYSPVKQNKKERQPLKAKNTFEPQSILGSPTEKSATPYLMDRKTEVSSDLRLSSNESSYLPIMNSSASVMKQLRINPKITCASPTPVAAKNDSYPNAVAISNVESHSTFGQPMSVNDKLQVCQVVLHYVSDFLPWNRVCSLSDKQEKRIKEIEQDLIEIQERLDGIEAKHHSQYQFIVKSPKYQEAKRLVIKTRMELSAIQTRMMGSTSQIGEIEARVSYVNRLMGDITSKTAKKEARLLNIQEKRRVRRARR
jgi:hypothetical protein